MIVVKKDYYYIDEVIDFCQKNKKYRYFIKTLQHLKLKGERYISANFFYNDLSKIKKHLTDLSEHFHINYFNYLSNSQKYNLLNYFEYKKLNCCPMSYHLKDNQVCELLKQGYVINFLGFYTNIEKLSKKGIFLFDYSKIIILENKKKTNKKLFLGAYK